EHDLALVVELLRLERPEKRLLVADEAFARAHEDARVARRVVAVLVFGVAIAVVDADADDLPGVGHRRQELDVGQVVIRRACRGELLRASERVGRKQLAKGADLAEAAAEIDDSAVLDHAEARAAAGRKAREAHVSSPRARRARARGRGASRAPASQEPSADGARSRAGARAASSCT